MMGLVHTLERHSKAVINLQIVSKERNSYLSRIVTEDEKWIHFNSLKRKKSWVKPGQPSASMIKRNIHQCKVMLYIYGGIKKVHYELLKCNETITAVCYQEQLVNLSQGLK